MSDAIEQLRNFIDGRWEEAPDRMPTINPANGAQIAWLPKSDRACARKAIAAGVYRTPAWHMIGTCRMGVSPEMSVVNKWQQSWDVPNMFIVDGSVLTTGGMVNPTPTISALALRASTYIRDNFRDLSRTTRAAA